MHHRDYKINSVEMILSSELLLNCWTIYNGLKAGFSFVRVFFFGYIYERIIYEFGIVLIFCNVTWSLCFLFLSQVPDKNALEKATYFVPTKSFAFQPFVTWEVKSDGPSQGKYIAVNEEGRLSVQACRMGTTFVKI